VVAETDRDGLETAARTNPRVAELLEGKTIVKTVVVPGRMVNYVVK
jgi:leucyl-tRNA synthetase